MRSIAGASRAAKLRPDDPMALYNSGRYAEALKIFQRLGRTGDVAARRFVAHCLDSLGRVDAAVAALRRLERGKEGPAASAALAAILQREGRRGALEAYRRAVKGAPKNRDLRRRLRELEASVLADRLIALRRRALEARDAGRLEAARALFLRLPPGAERESDLIELARLSALRAEEGRQWAAARKVWTRLSRLPGRAAEARRRLASLELGKLDEDAERGALPS